MKIVNKIGLLIGLALIAFTPIKLMSIGKKVDLDVLSPHIRQIEKIERKGIELGFYGTSCITISYKGETYLNDPFFSNPNYFQLISGKYPNRDYLIEEHIHSLDSISLISITHGHYDHCLDLLSFEDKYADNAQFVSSSSTIDELNVWLSRNLQWQKRKIDSEGAQWIYSASKNFRIFPIISAHQPHVGKHIRLLTGSYDEPLPHVPGPVWQWKEGQVYSYVVDLMDEEEVSTRMVIISGELPSESMELLVQMKEERRFDIAFVPYWHEKKSYPTAIQVHQELETDEIILHHWNNFFRTPEKPVQMMRTSNIHKEVERLKKEGLPVSLLLPFSKIEI